MCVLLPAQENIWVGMSGEVDAGKGLGNPICLGKKKGGEGRKEENERSNTRERCMFPKMFPNYFLFFLVLSFVSFSFYFGVLFLFWVDRIVLFFTSHI
mmetsp:Transcript_42184/g.108652  ORF Transcript_42184/g.108652 Transcript_42184/m.108652 type:complete len:98 (+) Transcript_42184:5516-5809(+)